MRIFEGWGHDKESECLRAGIDISINLVLHLIPLLFFRGVAEIQHHLGRLVSIHGSKNRHVIQQHMRVSRQVRVLPPMTGLHLCFDDTVDDVVVAVHQLQLVLRAPTFEDMGILCVHARSFSGQRRVGASMSWSQGCGFVRHTWHDSCMHA